MWGQELRCATVRGTTSLAQRVLIHVDWTGETERIIFQLVYQPAA